MIPGRNEQLCYTENRQGILEPIMGTQLGAAEIQGIHEQLRSAEILGNLKPFLGVQLCAGEIVRIYEQLSAVDTPGILAPFIGAQPCAGEIIDIYEQRCGVEIRRATPGRAAVHCRDPGHSRTAVRRRCPRPPESFRSAQRCAGEVRDIYEQLCAVEIPGIHERFLGAQ